jgi:DnaJ family protein C protein 17
VNKKRRRCNNERRRRGEPLNPQWTSHLHLVCAGTYRVHWVSTDLPDTGPLDTTVRLKYSATALPHLKTAESLAALLQPFGETDTIVVSIRPKTSKKKKSLADQVELGTALVPFKRIGDAFAAVCASGVKERGLEGVQISWAGDSGGEPELIGWLKRHGKLGVPSEAAKEQKPSTPGPVLVSSSVVCSDASF